MTCSLHTHTLTHNKRVSLHAVCACLIVTKAGLHPCTGFVMSTNPMMLCSYVQARGGGCEPQLSNTCHLPPLLTLLSIVMC